MMKLRLDGLMRGGEEKVNLKKSGSGITWAVVVDAELSPWSDGEKGC